MGLAARTALAATLAWLIALALPWEIAQTYPYFAPLGAVVGSYSTVRSSVRNSARAVAAIVCGALVSLVVAELLGRDLLVVPLVVFLATLLAGWRLFADQGSWVLTVGLFVLVVGVQHPVQYAVGYTVLTLLGGCVAVAVNTVLPSLPLAQSQDAVQRLATTLADQLEDLAEGLRRDDPPGPQEWAERLRSVAPVRESLRRSREETEESVAGNVRALRHVETVRQQHVTGVALENLAVRVEELTELLVESLTPRDAEVALPAGLRWPTADVLGALAAVLREREDDDATRTALRTALQRLSAAESTAKFSTERDRQSAGAVVTALRRCLGALDVRTPADTDDAEVVAPTPWLRPDPDLPRRSGLRLPTPGRWRARRNRRSRD
ncbi:aromatic acid exporter family protein [Kineococcus endophyticus]|uniref:Aromatic acid exporter family protein n=1 Tax=Kineococcus endophyticus TaxID=1181883 RepID=A0ABV3P9J0_9ACTN